MSHVSALLAGGVAIIAWRAIPGATKRRPSLAKPAQVG